MQCSSQYYVSIATTRLMDNGIHSTVVVGQYGVTSLTGNLAQPSWAPPNPKCWSPQNHSHHRKSLGRRVAWVDSYSRGRRVA